jgi:hypothetical protein
MAGGLLNIVALGNNNLFLTGNPSKTFFKVTYSKYSNFGLQKFRLDYNGLRELRLTEDSTFTFKVPRYAELLMDTYIVVTIPDIWSPIHHPVTDTINGTDFRWAPYDFKWIEHLGTNMIKEVVITCGSQTLQRYTGEYLQLMVERDFTAEKKELFNKMTGHVPEMNNPANSYTRANSYPSAMYGNGVVGAEPSIRGRNLYIPINTWFTLNAGCAFPLIALQYNELVINVTMRPIRDLFTVRDVFDNANNRPYIQPDFNETRFQMYRFLQSPPNVPIPINEVATDTNSAIIGFEPVVYENQISTWNADIHLISTYCFLSKEEAHIFAVEDHVYLVKDVFEHKYENITGSKRIKLDSNGMISSWMWYLQRNDVNMRNEWSNYSNWPYKNIPVDISVYRNDANLVGEYPNVDPRDNRTTGIYFTGNFVGDNHKHILETMGIVLDGEYRENLLTRGIYDYIEKYTRTKGNAKEGIYCYNFCLNTSPYEYQPSGAINLSKFKNIELEISTYVPPIDPVNSSFDIICDVSGNAIGVRKSNWKLYEYNYNMTLYEERYNVLSFVNGNCGMMYAR